MAKLIILSETTKQMTEKASHASRAGDHLPVAVIPRRC